MKPFLLHHGGFWCFLRVRFFDVQTDYLGDVVTYNHSFSSLLAGTSSMYCFSAANGQPPILETFFYLCWYISVVFEDLFFHSWPATLEVLLVLLTNFLCRYWSEFGIAIMLLIATLSSPLLTSLGILLSWIPSLLMGYPHIQVMQECLILSSVTTSVLIGSEGRKELFITASDLAFGKIRYANFNGSDIAAICPVIDDSCSLGPSDLASIYPEIEELQFVFSEQIRCKLYKHRLHDLWHFLRCEKFFGISSLKTHSGALLTFDALLKYHLG